MTVFALTALCALLATPSQAASGQLEHWQTTIKVGEKEAAISQTLGQADEGYLPSDQAEELEKYLEKTDTPVVVFEVEPETSLQSSGLKPNLQNRIPSAVAYSNFLERLKARFPNLQVIRFSKEQLTKAADGAGRLIQFFGRAPGIFKDELKQPDPYTSHTLTWGIVHTAFQTTVKGLAWFAAPGVSPLVAFGITLGWGAWTATAQIFQKPWDRTFFKVLEKTPEGIKVKEGDGISEDHMMRRRAFNYLVMSLITLASGGGSAALGFHNLLQALPSMTVAVEGRTLIASETAKIFRTNLTAEKTLLASRLSNLIMFTALPLALIDMAGASPILMTIGGVAIHATLPATFAAYFGIWAALRFAPEPFLEFLRLPTKIGKLSKSTGAKVASLTRRIAGREKRIESRARPRLLTR